MRDVDPPDWPPFITVPRQVDYDVPDGHTRFHTRGLLGKWGFSDGDLLEDLLYDNDIDVPLRLESDDGDDVEHRILYDVVAAHVAPKVDAELDLYFVTTTHNPVRTRSVNGTPIDCTEDTGITLDPEHVDVPNDVIIGIARPHIQAFFQETPWPESKTSSSTSA